MHQLIKDKNFTQAVHYCNLFMTPQYNARLKKIFEEK